jgi:hypothetical protein
MPGLMAGQMYCTIHRTVTSAGTCPQCDDDPDRKNARYPGIKAYSPDPYAAPLIRVTGELREEVRTLEASDLAPCPDPLPELEPLREIGHPYHEAD